MNPDTLFMEKALKMAFSSVGITSPNPPVGAVIVKNNKIIGSGSTSTFGGNHAEVNAINSCTESTEDSVMYVTLEPCCHFGKTPPCTMAIIAAKIKKVVIAAIDPNPLVCGKGILELENAGIETIIDKKNGSFARELLEPFKTYLEEKRPYIVHKAAMTLDGCTASHNKDSKWITSESSRALSHRLRSVVDAVIVGKGTYIVDDPRLDVRNEYLDNKKVNVYSNESFLFSELISNDFEVKKRTPLRVLAGFPDRFENRSFFYDDNYLIFCSESDHDCDIPEYVDREKIIPIGFSGKKFIEKMLKILYDQGVMFAMVEGGARLNASFHEAVLPDSYLYFFAPKVLGGGHPLFKGSGEEMIKNSRTVNHKALALIDGDLAVYGEFK
ncbi:MAG TPA: bifunctional diaminohydroxyphosphoribosylaminopyrimidine deaminase/5-amino-6-(5-phosphoribosylamino)uracil reductase RibD [Spirochaetota bacterium]|nr:bifunctional diaminohydroxyphosphoribosylaminopyrimidine deaminase/5-amino-6-(5-phosphoribosylamino)uracil reductase RibD [Spirochaetota bacterium]